MSSPLSHLYLTSNPSTPIYLAPSSSSSLENLTIDPAEPTETFVAPATPAIDSHAGASFFCRQIQQLFQGSNRPLRVLIAGCGSGHEAVAIQQTLGAKVDAVDVEDFVADELKRSPNVRFHVAGVCDLPYEENTFDAIFYHHVIEHVDRPADSLVELHRVLRSGGWMFIGTPNRHRLLSSIGAYQQSEWDATFANKLVDNLRDWRDRCLGRFRNELGAHAGFSQKELDRMLARQFAHRNWTSRQYLRFKYETSKFAWCLPVVTHPAVCWFAAPGIYAFCQK